MPPKNEQTCGNCAAFVAESKGGGTCHRKAPHCQMNGMMQDSDIMTLWPYVESDDWCYEWVPEETAE